MRKLLLTLLSAVALAALVGCGGHSATIAIPANPSGGNAVGFTTANLSGTYVFTANGLGTNYVFAVAGTFVADGAGHITSGTRDTVNDAGGQSLNETIDPANSSYSVNQDGRGQLILTGPSGQVIYRFVLQSPTSGKFFQDGTTTDNFVRVDAVGTLQQQIGAPAAPLQTQVLRLDGEDTARFPYGAIGAITFPGDGTLSATIDENDSGTFSSQLAGTGAVSLSGSSRGTATLTTPAGINSAAHHFIVYYVSPFRYELLSTDTNFFLHGHLELQSSIAPSVATFTGDQVFSLNGYDSTGNPLVETGRFTLNGAGALTNGIQDYNQNETFFNGIGFTGSYNVTSNGRWTASLSAPAVSVLTSVGFVGWQVNSQESVVLTTSASSTAIPGYQILETGTMNAQAIGLSNSSILGNFATDFGGFSYLNSVGNVESIGNYAADGIGNLNGTIDFQTDGGGLTTNSTQVGLYNVDLSTGRSTGTVDGVTVYVYTLNPNTLSVISSDPASAFQGMLVMQLP